MRSAVLLACLSLVAPASATVLTLTPGASWLRDVAFSSGADVAASATPAPGPLSGVNAIALGPSAASTSYRIDDSGVEIAVTQARGGAAGDAAWSYANLFFTLDRDVSFTLGGAFTVDDAGPGGQEVVLSATLGAAGTGIPALAYSAQESRATVDESLVLGGAGGDFSNLLIGSLTGTLSAGTEYRLAYLFRITNGSGGTVAPAGANGLLRLTFAVPEPATATLLLLGLALVAPRRRGR